MHTKEELKKIKIVDLLKKLNKLSNILHIEHLYTDDTDEKNSDKKNKEAILGGILILSKKRTLNALIDKYPIKDTYFKTITNLCVSLKICLIDHLENQWIEDSLDVSSSTLKEIDTIINSYAKDQVEKLKNYKALNHTYSALFELILTENTFVKNCQNLDVDGFLEMIKNNHITIDEKLNENIRYLIDIKNIKNIFDFKLESMMTYTINLNNFIDKINNIIYSKEFSEFQKQILKNLIISKDFFNYLFKEKNIQEKNFLSKFNDITIAPVQRLTRYPLMAKEAVSQLENIPENYLTKTNQPKLLFISNGLERRAKLVNENIRSKEEKYSLEIKKIHLDILNTPWKVTGFPSPIKYKACALHFHDSNNIMPYKNCYVVKNVLVSFDKEQAQVQTKKVLYYYDNNGQDKEISIDNPEAFEKEINWLSQKKQSPIFLDEKQINALSLSKEVLISYQNKSPRVPRHVQKIWDLIQKSNNLPREILLENIKKCAQEALNYKPSCFNFFYKRDPSTTRFYENIITQTNQIALEMKKQQNPSQFIALNN